MYHLRGWASIIQQNRGFQLTIAEVVKIVRPNMTGKSFIYLNKNLASKINFECDGWLDQSETSLER